jgi:hypothetical protein
MSYAGHVQDMINRTKANRSSLLARREHRKQQMANQVKHTKSMEFADEQMQVEDIEKVKAEIRAQAKREGRQRRVRLVVIFVAIVAILVFLLA